MRVDASYHAGFVFIKANKSENCIQIKVNNLGRVTASGQNFVQFFYYKYAFSSMRRIFYQESNQHEIENHRIKTCSLILSHFVDFNQCLATIG